MENHAIINLNGISIYLLVIRQENTPEYLKTLTFQELERYNTLKNETKRLEFAASRYLKHLHFGNKEITYLEHGTPKVEDGHGVQLIALTHSKGMTGLSWHREFPVAIDLELISDKSVKLAPKFCSEEEALFLNMQSPEEMTLLWSFKETLYKLSDRNGLIFKKDLRVRKDENGYYGEVLMKDTTLTVRLAYQRVNDFYLTCNYTFQLPDADNTTNC